MERDSIVYNGIEYPIIIINGNKIDKDCLSDSIDYIIADDDLWAAIEDDFNDGVQDAIDIDSEIFYYCGSGFVASKPSEKKVIEYFKNEVSL